ncbi:MAG: hypothetical protein M3540_11485 [Actinomycetota bacterium]|nr:hypothetical protein [Actinomycetota bacterium]
MPKYRFRLESEDGEFRVGATVADSKADAKDMLESREFGYAGYRLTIAELAEAEREPDTPQNRSRLALHHQAQPYKLVSLEQVKA